MDLIQYSKMYKKKTDLYQKFIRSKSKNDETLYKNYKNVLINVIRNAKKLYYQRKLEEDKSDPRKLWNTLLQLTRKNKHKNELPELFEIENKLETNPQKIAHHFNNFFSTVGASLDASLPPSTSDPLQYLVRDQASPTFHFHPINEAMVQKTITSLGNKGAGYDGMSAKILKRISLSISPHLTHLFNLCLAHGVFPDEFKIALVVPIYISGSKSSFTNYRPISILPILAKVFEKIVYQQIIEYLNENNTIFKNQFGFQKSHSTFMPIALLYDDITSALTQKKVSAAIYLDFSKAFDTVNHHILLSKLRLYGIHGTSLKLFSSYLENRTQYVKFNRTITDEPCRISTGVPQGSVLGPLLFLLYVNDLHKCSLIPKFYLFADDTALFFTANNKTSLEKHIQDSLKDITAWLCCNRLSLNVKKSNYQIFSTSPQNDLNIQINNENLQRKFCTKYLGISIEEDLRWTQHIKNVGNTISRNIGIIKRAPHILNSGHTLLLYNYMILPIINYGLPIWGSTYEHK
ncbi:MAG: reverse transcriptase family protein [Bacteroidota bacterium]